jgi:hypothetical protein
VVKSSPLLLGLLLLVILLAACLATPTPTPTPTPPASPPMTPTPAVMSPGNFSSDCLVAVKVCKEDALWQDDGNVLLLPEGTVVYVVVNPLTGKWDMSFKSVFCTAWDIERQQWISGRVAAQSLCFVP